MIFSLVGNQNCGKTTLFNQLTGSNQHVGNFPGVTVEKKEGTIKKHKDVTVVDLPGIYSLSPYTSEEVVTRDFLLQEKPTGIINIVDATNLERNIYLTLQLMELQLPMVVALNMMDAIESSGSFIDVAKLEEELGVPVVPISASKNAGIGELVERIRVVGQEKRPPKRLDFCKGPVHKAVHSVAHLIEEQAKEREIPIRFAATKLVEGDFSMAEKLALNETDQDIIHHIVEDMEQSLGTDREAAMADMRYEYIEQLCRIAVIKKGETKEQLRSVKIDAILTHRFFAIPIFLGILFTIFWLTFGVVGATLSDWFSMGIDRVTMAVDRFLYLAGSSDWVHSLVIDGVFAGVGSVLSFLPTILILFFFLSLLEDSGYMARVAFVMDKLLRKIGLSGRSFVPMLIGFGCSVPAIMATRTLSSERDRKMTILLIPFMSCSAKLPIYALFTAAFFPEHGALVMIGLYGLGVLVGILVALLFKNALFVGNPVPFVMELPAYRLPSAKSVGLHMWEKAKDFLIKAFTVIFVSTLVIWVLQSFDHHLAWVEDPAQSLLAGIGRQIAPFFRPLGFGDWRAATALLTGLTAKEAVVSTLSVLVGGGDTEAVLAALTQLFPTSWAAVSFLIFTLLYMPCVAAMAAMKRELGDWQSAVLAMIFQIAIAWLVAFSIYQIGLHLSVSWVDVLVILLLGMGVVLALTRKRRGKQSGCCGDCAQCQQKKEEQYEKETV